MSCADMRVLLHGMLDHELDLADAVGVETHMQVCPDCTAEYRKQGALRAAICRSEPRYRAPHDLRARIITALRLQTDVSCRAPWWRGAVTGWMGRACHWPWQQVCCLSSRCLASRQFSKN